MHYNLIKHSPTQTVELSINSDFESTVPPLSPIDTHILKYGYSSDLLIALNATKFKINGTIKLLLDAGIEDFEVKEYLTTFQKSFDTYFLTDPRGLDTKKLTILAKKLNSQLEKKIVMGNYLRMYNGIVNALFTPVINPNQAGEQFKPN